MMSSSKLPLSPMRRFSLALVLPMAIFGAIAIPNRLQMATAQTSGGGGGPLTIRSDVQEYDAKTQVGIARGRVQMDYPERGIKATAAQAQFFNRERRIVLSGNVFIYQQGGNSIQGETVTYLIDEGRFIAQPRDQSTQVQSVYIVRDTQIAPAPGKAPATPSSRR